MNRINNASHRNYQIFRLLIYCIISFFIIALLMQTASASDCKIIKLTDAFSEGKCLYPSWSPDGTRIAYQGNSSLWIMGSDGSNKTCLYENLPVVHPLWSPSEEEIAFSVDDGEDLDIWTIRSDGTGARRLTNDLYDNFLISWSTDGKKVAYFLNKADCQELWVMNSDGTGQKSIFNTEIYNCNNQIEDGDISWNPQGDHIVLTSESQGDCEIYIIEIFY